jgi:superfamily II DNA helicase RecQ
LLCSSLFSQLLLPLPRLVGFCSRRTSELTLLIHSLELLIKPALNSKAKLALLVPFLAARGEGASIVYLTTQAQAEELCVELVAKKVDARFYHAGMPADKRKEVQDWFMTGKGVVVATIAFGYVSSYCLSSSSDG